MAHNEKLEKTVSELCKRFKISYTDNSQDNLIKILKNKINWHSWDNSNILLTNQDEKDFMKTAKMFGIDFNTSMESMFKNTILPRLGLEEIYDSFLKAFGQCIDWEFFSKYSKWSLDLLEKYKDKYVWKYCTNLEYDDVKHLFNKYPYLQRNSPWYMTKYELRKKLQVSYANENLNLYVKEHQECMILEVETEHFIIDEDVHNFVIKYENEEIQQMTRDLVDISFGSSKDKKMYLKLNNFDFLILECEGKLKFQVKLII